VTVDIHAPCSFCGKAQLNFSVFALHFWAG